MNCNYNNASLNNCQFVEEWFYSKLLGVTIYYWIVHLKEIIYSKILEITAICLFSVEVLKLCTKKESMTINYPYSLKNNEKQSFHYRSTYMILHDIILITKSCHQLPRSIDNKKFRLKSIISREITFESKHLSIKINFTF